MSGGIAAPLGVWRVRKHFADGVEGFQVSSGIGTRRAPDGRLIDNHDFADVRIAIEAVAKFLDASAHVFRRQRFVQNVMNQRGLP